ncbi:hypothetical protein [Streptomyces candidus]|uniref:Lipoprotein n=1 Tax=Streptomyces candidus TaxID=67283 RepID=A0A7X0HCT8_9ACTN|nr:hypothetical protein [Streptomyces candidus]MBB6435204.1 hypothetical protein [Streptomyces candidus]GHH40475.1 hypothetical protein GCM10018773_21620 [Streptomyces candidus]
MLIATVRRAAVLGAALAALTVSCGPTSSPEGSATAAPSADAATAAPSDAGSPSEVPSAGGDRAAGEGAVPDTGAEAAVTPGPERVRDAFAGLQATLNDSCETPGGCGYFLGRVNEELMGLKASMKADPKGPGHFSEPLAWIKALDAKLGTDRGTANLTKHKTSLLGTRDKINTWMQGHPDDYR